VDTGVTEKAVQYCTVYSVNNVSKVKIDATKEDCKIIQFHLKYRLGDATKNFKFKQKDM
jgi:hypothetical protein